MKLQRFTPTIKHLEEPTIEVGESIAVPEPKMGWTLLGPYGHHSKQCEINLGLIGDAESIEKTKDQLERLKLTTYGKEKNFLHINFPGLDRLGIRFNVQWIAEISEQDIKLIENTPTLLDRVTAAGKIIRDKIKSLSDKTPTPDLIIVAYPKKVDDYCVQGAIGHKKSYKKTELEKQTEKRRAQHVTLDKLFGMEQQKEHRSVVLRSILKAAGMQHNLPIQILRTYTQEPYNPDRPRREDDATTFWNLVVAAFYKTNHIPWRVRGLMKDTCYLGISFFRDRNDSSNMRTALAQVISLDAEGFVLKGTQAIIDENNAPHVSESDAAKLVEKAVEIYKRNCGVAPKRVVIHKTSRFNDEEKQGFKIGSKDIHEIDLVAFGTRSIKLVRWGHEPPVRGTMVRLPDRSVLLYTFGYIPYLEVYPGPRVPSPLEILEHHGTTQIDAICREILALTKLNWNNAKFCSKAPITIAFARRVGEIIRECPADMKLSDKLWHYM